MPSGSNNRSQLGRNSCVAANFTRSRALGSPIPAGSITQSTFSSEKSMAVLLLCNVRGHCRAVQGTCSFLGLSALYSTEFLPLKGKQKSPWNQTVFFERSFYFWSNSFLIYILTVVWNNVNAYPKEKELLRCDIIIDQNQNLAPAASWYQLHLCPETWLCVTRKKVWTFLLAQYFPYSPQ